MADKDGGKNLRGWKSPFDHSPPPPPPAPAESKPSLIIVGSENSEKMRLERIRYNEAAYRRITGTTIFNEYGVGHAAAPLPGSAIYKVMHEMSNDFMPYQPGIWHNQILLDFFSAKQGLRSLTTKGRQVYNTTLFGIIILDAWAWKPGSVCLIHNVNQDEAKATLESRVAAPLRESMPGLAGNRAKCSIADYQIHLQRPPGEGGDSFIYAGMVTGRGQTPYITLATEFPVLCRKDWKKAKRFLAEAVRGGQYASHNIEGTVADIRETPILDELMKGCRERQLRRIKPAPQDWVFYFYPWFSKPGNIILPGDWDEKRKIPKVCEDYFRHLEEPSTVWANGRDYYKGGLKLKEEQKRWYAIKFENEALGDWGEMFSDYPSLPEEGRDMPDEAKYCRPLLAAAQKEGRITEIDVLPNKPVHVTMDIGWEDQTVMIFLQRGGGGFWNILDGFAVNHYQFPALHDKLRAYNWEERSGSRPIIHLPHDGHHAYAGTARKITTAEGRSLADDFREVGYEVSDKDRFPKPANKMLMFPIMREAFRHMRFNKERTEDLRDALKQAHIQTIKRDEQVTRGLKKTPLVHWHDALELAARLIVEEKRYSMDGGHGDAYSQFFKNTARGRYGRGLNAGRYM